MHPSERLHSTASSARAADDGADGIRRMLLLAPLIAGLPLALKTSAAHAGKIDPSETTVTLSDALNFVPWIGGPAGSGEMVALYGSLDKPGPYLVLMKWHPGYMSAPHTYLTDRLSVVVSGTWWVNSGADFDPKNTTPANPRLARLPLVVLGERPEPIRDRLVGHASDHTKQGPAVSKYCLLNIVGSAIIVLDRCEQNAAHSPRRDTHCP